MQKKRILCFGDSNTWGYDARTKDRFPEEIRWTGVMQEKLGSDYTVIEEGLCGRTTVFEDPLVDGLRGLTYLSPCLRSHGRLDVLILMLGTNDCKERFSATGQNIADGMKRLVCLAQELEVWEGAPKILVVAPAPIRKECESSFAAGEMGICSEKSEKLAKLYQECAKECGCHFFDAASCVQMNSVDYMHLDEEGHSVLGNRLAEELKERYGNHRSS